ncbi:hypothetical protein K1719_011377 [Acacia pycnantha]|nr:hypothetical protein K1719_011377 [Acacia pycnantha]
MAKFLKCLLFWLLMQLLQLQNSQTELLADLIMRIGVPKKDGFTQFVKLRWQPRENKYQVSGGYCIDVFDAVIKQLPFKVSPRSTPFVNQTGQSAGTYDSLVQQIPQMYDAVVGDVTIVANRSSWGLWLSIAIASIFIGFVISIMERYVNNLPERGSQTSTKQLNVITILWFPLLQAVLPDQELLAKNCSRFVLVLWLVLASICANAKLHSMLVINLDRLLLEKLKVDKSRVKNYSAIEDYKDALGQGSRKGGVDVIFDEVPHLKVFLKKYGSNYALIGTRHRTDGFAFLSFQFHL